MHDEISTTVSEEVRRAWMPSLQLLSNGGSLAARVPKTPAYPLVSVTARDGGSVGAHSGDRRGIRLRTVQNGVQMGAHAVVFQRPNTIHPDGDLLRRTTRHAVLIPPVRIGVAQVTRPSRLRKAGPSPRWSHTLNLEGDLSGISARGRTKIRPRDRHYRSDHVRPVVLDNKNKIHRRWTTRVDAHIRFDATQMTCHEGLQRRV